MHTVRRVRLGLIALAVLAVLTLGCGPLGTPGASPDNAPPSQPAAAAPDPWISFVAVVLDDMGNETDDDITGVVTVGAYDHNLQPETDWVDVDNQHKMLPLQLTATYPYPFGVIPKPEVWVYSFTASGFLPADWRMKCEVLRGDARKLGPELPVISYQIGIKAGPGGGPASANCTYPELPTGVRPS